LISNLQVNLSFVILQRQIRIHPITAFYVIVGRVSLVALALKSWGLQMLRSTAVFLCWSLKSLLTKSFVVQSGELANSVSAMQSLADITKANIYDRRTELMLRFNRHASDTLTLEAETPNEHDDILDGNGISRRMQDAQAHSKNINDLPPATSEFLPSPTESDECNDFLSNGFVDQRKVQCQELTAQQIMHQASQARRMQKRSHEELAEIDVGDDVNINVPKNDRGALDHP
jgi:hypothetical protein